MTPTVTPKPTTTNTTVSVHVPDGEVPEVVKVEALGVLGLDSPVFVLFTGFSNV